MMWTKQDELVLADFILRGKRIEHVSSHVQHSLASCSRKLQDLEEENKRERSENALVCSELRSINISVLCSRLVAVSFVGRNNRRVPAMRKKTGAMIYVYPSYLYEEEDEDSIVFSAIESGFLDALLLGFPLLYDPNGLPSIKLEVMDKIVDPLFLAQVKMKFGVALYLDPSDGYTHTLEISGNVDSLKKAFRAIIFSMRKKFFKI